ncbi:MAG: hypothetical protein EOP00_29815 [Pedobacter sp.]|nr:MAG: hypothetical protein EOP00_29815 [Pedobacter sp.]
MTDNQWATQLFYRGGIIIILLLFGVVGGAMVDNKVVSRDSLFHFIMFFYLFALPFIFGLWFITIIVNTIVLIVKKKTQLRNINLISFCSAMIVLIIIISYID